MQTSSHWNDGCPSTASQSYTSEIYASGIGWWKFPYLKNAYDRSSEGLSFVFTIHARVDPMVCADKLADREDEALCALFALFRQRRRSRFIPSPDIYSLHLLDQRL